jgi:predicted GH43/DUF377 family glycosyl hydrolase
MINIKKEGVILSKTELEFENEGVFNPAVYKENGTLHMFYRAVRDNNNSTIGYCNFSGPIHLNERSTTPLIVPEYSYESKGVEDPRITKIDDLFYLTYTAYNNVNALGALATSTDLKHFAKQGIIVPQIHCSEFLKLISQDKVLLHHYTHYNSGDHLVWDKNVIFFPRRINNRLYFLHRIRPDIQLVSVQNLEELTENFWKNYFMSFKENIILSSKHKHEERYIGGGCPPLETKHGWLLIYHGVQGHGKDKTYSACAALMDINDPRREIARLPYPLFKPDNNWELKGDVDNVCFPTGTALFGDMLCVYYGAADKRIACATLSFSALTEELLRHAH